MLLKIILGIILYIVIAYLMIKMEISCGVKRGKLTKPRKVIPYHEVQQRYRTRDHQWD